MGFNLTNWRNEMNFFPQHGNQIWSYGGGTQSIAIAVLIAQGRLPKPDIAVIADTGREAQTTWDYLDKYVQPALDDIGVEIHVIPHSFDGTGYNYVDLYGGKKKDTLLIPAFVGDGMLRGYCSTEWKRDPVRRYCRKQGVDGGEMWIGFSTDELERCRIYKASDKWRQVYPLLDFRMSRYDCIAKVKHMGWPEPPKSACWMCPYRDDHGWKEMRHDQPRDYQKAVEFERELNANDTQEYRDGMSLHLHRSGKPMDELVFSDEEDLFAKPCDSGMCFT